MSNLWFKMLVLSMVKASSSKPKRIENRLLLLSPMLMPQFLNMHASAETSKQQASNNQNGSRISTINNNGYYRNDNGYIND
ncbi:predicted protein [Arabidopsis lyrata subsp. lyrata]|uniref:Predicted protein n=1 Tax=Arabidopsis lyrata subsp. lyrata TaxID=81972 RepID=D7KXG0_ARALL|nr:predicted protein [Arabidopsis lyrata subsp. lyrata]